MSTTWYNAETNYTYNSTSSSASSSGDCVGIYLGSIAANTTTAISDEFLAGGFRYRYTTETTTGATYVSTPTLKFSGPAIYDGTIWEKAPTQKQIDRAHKRSLKLLKQWLSPEEYNYLMEEGQLELPSQYEKDTIYIVDKNPMKRIGIKKEGKIVEKSLCIHPSHSYADGDVLLSNILLLKTDEKKFLEIANVHDYYA